MHPNMQELIARLMGYVSCPGRPASGGWCGAASGGWCWAVGPGSSALGAGPSAAGTHPRVVKTGSGLCRYADGHCGRPPPARLSRRSRVSRLFSFVLGLAWLLVRPSHESAPARSRNDPVALAS